MFAIKKLTTRQQKGAQAEKLAEQFLIDHGLTVITRNYRCKQGEIDLIMQDHNTVVFVEVRHRVSNAYGTAAESITTNKQAKIIKAATLFMMQKGWYQHKAVRFDVITIDGELIDSSVLKWIKQAFY